MQYIETYFNNNTIIDKTFYSKQTEFKISNNELFKSITDINLWANDIQLKDTKTKRLKQQQFRKLILTRYNKCIITNKYIEKECEACHIIPVEHGGSYDIDNGLLINSCMHITFDDLVWSINPDTLTIDIMCNDEHIVGSILEYNGKLVNITPNNIMKLYLTKRWKLYLDAKTEYNNKN